MIFTGKYSNMNFRIIITYYPTLPCEYHKSTSPNIYLEEGRACEERRLMTQDQHKRTTLTPGSNR